MLLPPLHHFLPGEKHMLTKVSIVAAVAATLMMLTPAFLKASARAVAEGVVVAAAGR